MCNSNHFLITDARPNDQKSLYKCNIQSGTRVFKYSSIKLKLSNSIIGKERKIILLLTSDQNKSMPLGRTKFEKNGVEMWKKLRIQIGERRNSTVPMFL